MKSKVIILLAAYNGERFIGQQLKTTLNQTYKPFKIQINIDQSSDQTVPIAESYAKEFPEIQILNKNKSFGSAATNFIYLLNNVDLTDIDYIALADQDDLWKEGKLENAIQQLVQGYDGYSSNVEAFWDDGRRKVLVKNQPQQSFDHFFESAGPGCTYVMNKKLSLSMQQFLKNGHFNKLDNYHDWLIYAFARENGFKWFIDYYPGVQYRQHTANVFGANVGIKAFISRFNRVLSGEGFDFAFILMKELKAQDRFIQSLFPISRINFLRLAFNAKNCRRGARDQIYFFFACILLAIIFPKNLQSI